MNTIHWASRSKEHALLLNGSSRGGGGGGTSIYMCILGMCCARDPGPFSALNFRSGAHHFHKWASPILAARQILHVLPLRRPSFSKFLYVQAVHCPGLAAGQSASQTCPTKSVPETLIFTLELTPEPCIFTLEPAPEPPIFHFATVHTYQNVGCPLPPWAAPVNQNVFLFPEPCWLLGDNYTMQINIVLNKCSPLQIRPPLRSPPREHPWLEAAPQRDPPFSSSCPSWERLRGSLMDPLDHLMTAAGHLTPAV